MTTFEIRKSFSVIEVLMDLGILSVEYDATNGTVSNGVLVCCGLPYIKGGNPQDLTNPLRLGVLRVPICREQW